MIGNLLLAPVGQRYNPEEEEEMEERYKEAQAVRQYLRGKLRAVWGQLASSSQERQVYKQFYFDALALPVEQRKLQLVNRARIRQVFSRLKHHVDSNAVRRQWIADKLKKAQEGRLKKLMAEWKAVTHIETATKRLELLRRKEQIADLILFLRENTRNAQLRKLNIEAKAYTCSDIYSHNLLTKAFASLQINAKSNRLLRSLRSPRLTAFLTCLKNYNKQSTHKSTAHFQRKMKQLCFSSWKEQYRSEIAVKFHTLHLLTSSFQFWRSRIPQLVSEREIEHNNECIANIFIARSRQKVMRRVLMGWHECVKEAKENRHHNAVLNKYADATCRQSLLRRYFEMLRINCLNGQVKRRFHQQKLKRKVMDALKIILTQSIAKEEKLISFIQHRESRKYFQRIKAFNQLQRNKVEKFRLAKIFQIFTFTIVSDYYRKTNQAIVYNNTNLLFKTVVTLKKAVHFRHQLSHLIAQINVKMPLKRWHRSFTLKRYLQIKQWQRMKSIMREWRLRVIRRQTDRKVIKEFNEFESSRKSDSRMEVFEFDNIMATIAKIRSNFMAEQVQTQPARGNHTASESINFSYSLEND